MYTFVGKETDLSHCILEVQHFLSCDSNNNNDDHHHDNVSHVIIMTRVIVRVHPVHLMNVD